MRVLQNNKHASSWKCSSTCFADVTNLMKMCPELRACISKQDSHINYSQCCERREHALLSSFLQHYCDKSRCSSCSLSQPKLFLHFTTVPLQPLARIGSHCSRLTCATMKSCISATEVWRRRHMTTWLFKNVKILRSSISSLLCALTWQQIVPC